MATKNCVFDECMLRDKIGKSIKGDEVVVHSLDFTRAWVTRGAGYAKCEGARV